MEDTEEVDEAAMAACRALLEASCVPSPPASGPGDASSGKPDVSGATQSETSGGSGRGRGGALEGFQVGRTKVFLKGATAAALDQQRAAVLAAAATRLQAAYRCDV